MKIPSEKEVNSQIYRHCYGGIYVTLGYATHSETGEKMIIYYSLSSPGETWARPATMFFEDVTLDGVNVKRFTLLGVLTEV